MKKKITLTIDEKCIEQGKAFAKREGKSVSQLVEDYFAAHAKPLKPLQKKDLPPRTRSLTGILTSADTEGYRDEYRKHLEEKHR